MIDCISISCDISLGDEAYFLELLTISYVNVVNSHLLKHRNIITPDMYSSGKGIKH
jgi:hypothetical protein